MIESSSSSAAAGWAVEVADFSEGAAFTLGAAVEIAGCCQIRNSKKVFVRIDGFNVAPPKDQNTILYRDLLIILSHIYLNGRRTASQGVEHNHEKGELLPKCQKHPVSRDLGCLVTVLG